MESPRKTVGELLDKARLLLTGRSETAVLDAQVLLGHELGQARSWLLTHPEEQVSPESVENFNRMLAQRAAGVPLPYLLGEWEFFGRAFAVSNAVLIPRPETELLVEIAVNWITARDCPLRIVDVGTGSGIVAVSIALECSECEVIAVDISPDALEIAFANAKRHRASNVRFFPSDLLYALPASMFPVDLICANLPYVPTATWEGLDIARHEPRIALDGGPDGLRVIERLLRQAKDKISTDGLLLLEIEASQGESAADLARKILPEGFVDIQMDLAGLPRILRIDFSEIAPL